MTTFLMNCWYMAAWSSEIDDQPVGRRLLDIPVVLFRTSSGEAAALHDVCPHRFVALSFGKVKGDNIQCSYHGLEFDRSGECVHYPFNQPSNANCKVRSYPVAERYDALWFWPGDPAKADPALIPDLSVNVGPGFDYTRGTMHINANYQLLNDNLLDLTHSRYLHPDFGGEDNWVPEVSFEYHDDRIIGRYHIPSLPATEFIEATLPEPSNGRNLCEVTTLTWRAPSICTLELTHAWANAPEKTFNYSPGSHVATPETETSFHYFWLQGLPKGLPPEMIEAFQHGQEEAFEKEDALFMERVQKAMGDTDFWDMKPIILQNDSGAVLARRRLRQMLKAEAETALSDADAA